MIGAALDLRAGAVLDLASSGLATTHTRIFGTTVVIVHRVNAEEHLRRDQHATGALRSLEQLDVLFDLPAHELVPLTALTPPTVRVLRAAPPGTVTFTDTTIVRQAVPITTPIVAMARTTTGRATSTGFREGLARASRFAAYCPRLLVAARLPEGLDDLLAEASSYGLYPINCC